VNVVFYSVSVKFWTASKPQRNAGRLAAVGLMLSLWLGTLALAAAPQLHRLLHNDAQDANHQA
jgi:hypothetical protein